VLPKYQIKSKISYIQKSFVISQKNLFVPKIRKNIFLPEEQEEEEEGQEELSLPVLQL
jgi:hypothetical protein